MGGLDVSYAGALGAGILSFLSPCVLPLVPPYLCFLGGVSLDQLTDDDKPAEPQVARRVFIAAIAFVLGFSTVFIALGATASFIGQIVLEYLDVMSQAAGVVIILLGLHFTGIFKISMLYKEARFHTQNKPAGLVGSYIIGLAFAFGWTPCVGPVLAAVLFIAGSDGSVGYGTSLLAVYSLGLGIPFLLAALAMKPFMAFMTRFRQHMKNVERFIGVLLILTGIMFLTGSISDVGFWLQETFPIFSQVG